MEELKKMYEKYGVKFEKPKRDAPKSFQEKQFTNEESFSQYISEKKYCINKEEDSLIFLSKLDRKYFSSCIFRKEGNSFIKIAHINGTYYEESQTLQIMILIVKPEERGEGLGTLLYNHFERKALKVFKIKAMIGSLPYWTENIQREHFYKNLGFNVYSSDENGEILNKIKKELNEDAIVI